MKFYLVLLIVGVCNSLSYQNKSVQISNNDTREMKSMHSTKKTDEAGQNPEGSSFYVQSSSSYQYPTNDDDHLHQMMLSSLNSKIPDNNPSDSRASDPHVLQTKSNSFSQSRFSDNQNQYEHPEQSFGFKPSQFLLYKNPENLKPSSRKVSQNLPSKISVDQRPPNNAAQRRNDENLPGNNYVNGVDESQHLSYGAPKPEYGVPVSEYGVPKPEYEVPETRDGSSFGMFPGSGPSFVAPAYLDPLPPPPAPIKGSIDYILIPLILIGLAGPIFVVLYVILGAFEAKLSPITSRSLGEYKPYVDTLISSVSRALDNSECLDYAACQVGSLCNQMGLTGDQLLHKYVQPITPQKYGRQMRMLISSMKEAQQCSIQKCLTF